MKTSSFLAMAGTTLVAASILGAGLVGAFPTTAVPAPSVAADSTPYQWRGYWDPQRVAPAGYVPDCPVRRMWADTPAGPRLKWRRACVVRD